ncbi:helix-turn-helix transcriptional regulator [Psychrobacter lutiphocae]|uniref:helix-turn-helix transcriptional regulator n=1 Tax=Psychrobacter lutiphocae TaxID=540500 RepID=UPI00036A1BFA|nr:AraC family transcriptional regulator [Psychrobacter lutiphocae]
MTIVYDELHWQAKKVGNSQVEKVSEAVSKKPVNITRETHCIREGFRLVREHTYTSVPMCYKPFENDYIGICFVFAPDSVNLKDLAFKEIYHKDLNITNGYQFDAETIYATNKQLYYVSLQFDKHFIESLNEQQPLPHWLVKLVLNKPKQIFERVSVSPVLRHLAWQICQMPTTNQISDSLRIESKALDWLASIIDSTTKINKVSDFANSNEFENRAKSFVMQACSIIHAEYGQPLTINELALRIGTNTSYLKRFFKQYTGQSIHEYLTQYRLNQAKTLLIQKPDLEIRVIAEICGYQAAHFSQLFKETNELTPSQFRQSIIDRELLSLRS